MPIRYEWTPEQKQQAEAANQWIMEALSKVMPGSGYMGQQAYQPIAQPMANAIMPGTLEDAMQSAFNTIGVGPLEIWQNYRNPEFIKALRKTMAQEQKSRGAMAQYNPTIQTGSQITDPAGYIPVSEMWPIQASSLDKAPDPADLILRGSWFHGMSNPARQQTAFNIPKGEKGDVARMIPRGAYEGTVDYGYSLPAANIYGLPGSTHATPSYVRFGEPYGISLSASPSVSAKFSPDQMIHRVMPLYEGPPTERTLQLWKPEHQKRFNEAYNEALNKLLPMPFKENPWQESNSLIEKYGKLLSGKHYQLQNESIQYPVEKLIENYLPINNLEFAGKFNTMFSDALKSQGTRGLLYNPRRFGEYEMLMLDPKWAMPLDYRPIGNYVYPTKSPNAKSLPKIQWSTAPNAEMTPGTLKGYQMADPEFAANHARLSDMFNLMPWTERINQENWQRILEQVDPAYREAVINQLFGNK